MKSQTNILFGLDLKTIISAFEFDNTKTGHVVGKLAIENAKFFIYIYISIDSANAVQRQTRWLLTKLGRNSGRV